MVLEGLFVIRPKSVKVGSRLGFSNWEWFATFKASISANDWFAAMLQWLVTVAFTMASSTLSLFRGARQVYFAFQFNHVFTYVKYQFEIGTGRGAGSAKKDRFLNALRLAPAGLSLASVSAKRAMPKPPVYRILRSCWRS